MPVAGLADMGGMSTVTTSATDTRRPAYGLGRVLILIYGIFALAATARSAVQLIRNPSEAPLAYSLSALAAVIYILATVSLAHNGKRMRRIAWGAVIFEALGVITIGIVSFLHPELFPRATVWSHFGAGYGFVPLVLPSLGIAWLFTSNPARLAQN